MLLPVVLALLLRVSPPEQPSECGFAPATYRAVSGVVQITRACRSIYASPPFSMSTCEPCRALLLDYLRGNTGLQHVASRRLLLP